MQCADALASVEEQYPCMRLYIKQVADYLKTPAAVMRDCFAPGIERIGKEAALRACRDWESFGIFPDIHVETDIQVAAVWDSPIFKALLEDGMGFYPPTSPGGSCLIFLRTRTCS